MRAVQEVVDLLKKDGHQVAVVVLVVLVVLTAVIRWFKVDADHVDGYHYLHADDCYDRHHPHQLPPSPGGIVAATRSGRDLQCVRPAAARRQGLPLPQDHEERGKMENKKSHDKTLNLVSLGDRRSHRGERYEFQIATKAEESYGFALQTCVKVTNIKYKKKVSVQQCPSLSKSRYHCGYFAQETVLPLERWSRNEPRGLGPECAQGSLDLSGCLNHQ